MPQTNDPQTHHPKPHDPLAHAWLWLLALSLGSTVLAVLQGRGLLHGWTPTLCGAIILSLACAKARLILSRYLGLAQAPRWQCGLDLVLGLYVALMLALYLAGRATLKPSSPCHSPDTNIPAGGFYNDRLSVIELGKPTYRQAYSRRHKTHNRPIGFAMLFDAAPPFPHKKGGMC